MQKRRLGSSTLEVSAIGLGGNNFGGRIDFAATERVVHAAIDLGIDLIDTADTYGNRGGSEEWLGRILGERRKRIVLATKFGMPMDEAGHARRRIAPLCHAGGRGVAAPAAHRLASISISCTGPTRARRSRRPCARSTSWCGRARCASSAAPTCPRSRSSRRRRPRGSTGLRLRLLPGRIQPAGARHRARAHSGGEGAWHGRFCPTSRSPAACSPASTGAMRRRRPARGCRGLRSTRATFMTERNWRIVARAGAIRRPPRPHLLELAFGWLLRDERGRQRDRGRDLGGAGRGQHPRRRLDAVAGGSGRDRPASRGRTWQPCRKRRESRPTLRYPGELDGFRWRRAHPIPLFRLTAATKS